MARYVIDAPTLLHLAANDVQLDPAHQLVAPNVVRTQAFSLLLAAVRRGEISEATALEHHDRFTAIKIRLLGDRVSRRTAWRIAREHDWEDLVAAEYLAVCRLQADALFTVDEAMASKARGIVPMASLSDLASA